MNPGGDARPDPRPAAHGLTAGASPRDISSMQSKATSVSAYLSSLPPDRRAAMRAVRAVVRRNLPRGFVECMSHGMIGWVIPLSRHAETYNGEPLPLAGLASQKAYMALYLMTVYGSPEVGEWFRAEHARAGLPLRMGKSCLRFRRLEDLPLDLVGRTIARVSVDEYIALYERAKGEW